MEPKLTLANAYYTWVQGENVWKMRNQDQEVLFELPHTFTEKECMAFLRLARKFELEAFQQGIAFGKQQYLNAFNNREEDLKGQITELCAMNEKLSTQLERHIIGGN